MTVEDKNFYIKNGLSVGSGKHQILDSDGRITANYYTLNTGGRYLSAGVDVWDLINNVGIPPLSTNAWNDTRNQFLEDKPRWDSVHSFVTSDSATNNTEYNRNTFVNVSGDTMLGYLQVGGPTYLENSLRVDGNTYLSAAMYVENDAHVMGDFRADGDVWLAVEGVYPKSIYLGATNDDRVVFYADVDSNIIPDKTKTYDFGSDDQQWNVLYTQDLSASRDANITRTVYANTIINNTSEYLSIYGGTGETDGAFFRLFHEDTTNPGNKNRFTIHADKFLVGDVLDDSGYSPWMMSISPDDNTVVFGSTIPDQNTFMTIHGSTAIKDTLRVEQDTTLQANLRVSGAGDIVGNFSVSGDTVLSGTMDVKGFTTLHDDLSVKGDLYVDGNAYLSAGEDGNIYVGDTNTDNVVFRADVNSDIIPESALAYDLGTDDKHWNTLYVNDVSASNDIRVKDTLYTDTIRADDRNYLHIAAGTEDTTGSFIRLHQDNRMFVHADYINFGDLWEDTDSYRPWVMQIFTDEQQIRMDSTLDVSMDATFKSDVWIKGNLRVDGNAYLSAGASGVINVGDTNTDNVVFHADVDSNIIPDDDVTFDLGTNTQQWKELFVQDISATNDVFVDNDLLVSANGTIGEDFRVSGHVTVSGNTVLSGTLDVKEFTTLHDDLSVKGDLYVDGNAYLSAGPSGSIYVGDNDTDSVVFTADVSSNFVPDTNNTFDLGTDDKHWNTLYVNDVSASNDARFHGKVYTDIIESDQKQEIILKSTDDTVPGSHVYIGKNNINLHSNAFNFGDIFEASDNYHPWILTMQTDQQKVNVNGELTVLKNSLFKQNIEVWGDTKLGDSSNDNVIFVADVDSNIIPDDDVTFDLGTSTQQWRELFVQDISATGDIYIDQNLAVSGAGDIVGNISVSGDMVLSGMMDVKGFTTLHDDLSVKGDLFVDGNAYLSAGVDGNIYVGDTNTDNVVFRADVDSGIIPNVDVKYDLGTNTQQWRELFIQDISATNSIFVDNDLFVSANGTIGQDLRVSGATVVSGYTELSGTLDVKDSTTLHSNLSTLGDTTTVGDTVLSGMLTVAQDISALSDLYVDGNVWFKGDGSGTINLGDSDTDSVVFVADVSSNIIPDTNVTYNLGTSTKQWQEIFVQDISASRDIVVDNNLTIGNDISARGDLYVDGNVWFRGDGSGVINLGDSDTDNVVFVADVDSDIIPNTNMSFDLGTADKHWMTTYTHDVSAHGNVNVENNIFAGGDTTVTGVLSVSGHTHMLSSLVVEQDVRIHGSLIVDDHAYFGFGDGAMNIGMSSDDKIVFNAEIDSHMIPDPSQTYDLGAIGQIWRYLYVHKVNTHDLSVTGDTHFSGSVTAHDGLTVVGDISATGDIYLRADTLRFSDKNFFNSVDASRGRALWTYVYGDSATNNSEYNNTAYLKTSGGEIDDLRVINDLTVDGDLEVNGNIYMDHDMMLTRSVEYLKSGEAQYVDLQGNNPNDPLQNSQYVVANWDNISNTHALVLPYNTTVKRVCLRASNSQNVDVRVGVHTNDKIVINSTEKEYQLFDRDPIEIRSNAFTDNYQTGLYTYTPGASAQAGSTLGLSISASRELRDLNVTIILSQRETKPGPPGLYDSVLIDHVEEW